MRAEGAFYTCVEGVGAPEVGAVGTVQIKNI